MVAILSALHFDSEYIWTWPDAEVEMLERLARRQKEEENEEEDSGSSADGQEGRQPSVGAKQST
jgi:hypothetical protein